MTAFCAAAPARENRRLPPGRQMLEQDVAAMAGIAGTMLNDARQADTPRPAAIDDLLQDFVRIRLLIVDENSHHLVGQFTTASGRLAVRFERCNGCGH